MTFLGENIYNAISWPSFFLFFFFFLFKVNLAQTLESLDASNKLWSFPNPFSGTLRKGRQLSQKETFCGKRGGGERRKIKLSRFFLPLLPPPLYFDPAKKVREIVFCSSPLLPIHLPSPSQLHFLDRVPFSLRIERNSVFCSLGTGVARGER